MRHQAQNGKMCFPMDKRWTQLYWGCESNSGLKNLRFANTRPTNKWSNTVQKRKNVVVFAETQGEALTVWKKSQTSLYDTVKFLGMTFPSTGKKDGRAVVT